MLLGPSWKVQARSLDLRFIDEFSRVLFAELRRVLTYSTLSICFVIREESGRKVAIQVAMLVTMLTLGDPVSLDLPHLQLR